MKLTVFCLLTVDDVNPVVQTMVLDTIRVGFPTARLRFWLNPTASAHILDTGARVAKVDGELNYNATKQEHFDFIRDVLINRPYADDEQVVILDGDLIFWSSCEWFTFVQPLAGMHILQHENPWSGSRYAERLHTSFLWCRPAKIQERLAACERIDFKQHAPYCQCEFIKPQVVYKTGDFLSRPMFYDTAAMLYAAIGGNGFADAHLNCYEHINSACFYNEMLQRLSPSDAADFQNLHETARVCPQALHGLNKKVLAKYQEWAQ